MNAYIVHLLILIAMYAPLAASLNLAVGWAGLLNLGHVAFFAVGAYTSALLTKAGVPFILAFMAAGVLAALCGYLLMLATRNLKGDYLALATLGFSFVVGSILLNWTSLTRGPLGLPGIKKPDFSLFKITNNTEFLLFTIIVCALIYFFLWRLTRSPYGVAVQATRDDELGMQALGKNTFWLKAQVLATSAFIAGMCGSLYAHYISYIDPSSFALTEIILLFSIVIVGGLVSLRGTFIATIILILLPEAMRFLALPSSVLGPLRQIFYAAILLTILFARPRGLLGKVDLA